MTIPSQPIALLDGALVDTNLADSIPNGTVIVEDGVIAAVGPSSAISLPRNALVIDAAGMTVLPGLIDCHVHLGVRMEPLHDAVMRSQTDIVVRCLQTGRDLIRSGITTARDAGGAPAGIRRAFAEGDFVGPRLQVAVTFLSQTGGHGDTWTPSGALIDTPMTDVPNGVVDGVDAIRAASRTVIRAGADWLKVMASGGVYSPNDAVSSTQFTEEEIRAVVGEARAAGLRGVLAHATTADSVKQVLRAGVRSIEHGSELDEEAIRMMVDTGSHLVPTFMILEELSSEARIQAGEVPPWAAEKITGLLELQGDHFRHATQAGVKLAMGSDSFNGMHAATEVASMIEHGGLSPLAAIEAATVGSAELLGLSDSLGTLSVGKTADIIVVDGDPLADSSIWRRPDCVTLTMLGGEIKHDPLGLAATPAAIVA